MLFYLIGIKGSAMSALANILIQEGHDVLGADVMEDFYTHQNLNIRIDALEAVVLNQKYFYIIGNAFKNHPLTQKIIEEHYSYDYYPMFLVHHFKDKKWICVSGTHGKTTTIKMLSTLLDETALIGDGTSTYHSGDYFILESCEYQNTFLNYHPKIGLVLNVDYDHVDFFKTKEEYERSFQQFINQCKICIVNGDECSYRADHVITYGIRKDNDVTFEYKNGVVKILNKPFYLPLKGKSYAYDFVGAYLVCKLLNHLDYDIQKRITSFVMPKRRNEQTIFDEQVIVLDYAHHPNEIKAIVHAVEEEYPDKKLIGIFEPHTITRLQCFKEDFKATLNLLDECYLYPLFTSIREHHQNGLEDELYQELGFPLYNSVVEEELTHQKNVVLLFLGAGSIDEAYKHYIDIKKGRN